MKIFVPESLYVPSGCSTAFVFIRRKSVPQCGSVRHIVPVHSPATIIGTMRSRIHGAPVAIRAEQAALVSPGYIVNAWFDDEPISATAKVKMIGRPAPPYCSGTPSLFHPASQ